MKKEIADKWVAALRSGKYSQGRHLLKQVAEEGTISYCCLGVLCELAIEDGLDVSQQFFNGDYSFESNSAMLSQKVMLWADMKTMSGMYSAFESDGNRRMYDLSGDNDEGMSFAEIADIISEKWEEL